MKAHFKGLIAALAALIALVCALFCMGAAPGRLPVSPVGPYDFEFEDYRVEMDVESSLLVHVKETMRVSFTGYDSHGIIRDFPLGGGQTYADFEARCDDPDFSPYTETSGDVLSWYLRGESLVRGEERTYTLSYTVRADLTEGVLPLDVLGYGFTADVKHFSARVKLPAGVSSYEVFSGEEGTEENRAAVSVEETKEGDNTVLSFEGEFPVIWGNRHGGSDCTYGVTLAVRFEKGAVSAPFEKGLLYALALSGLLVLATLLLRVCLGKQPLLVKTVNLSAPKRMDPLMMGKLIDGKVDGEDVSSLIFWFASEGYLTIDMRTEDDPVLVRSEMPIPEDMPRHRRIFLEGLFSGGEKVHTRTLSGAFYSTANAVKHCVDTSAGRLYEVRGTVVLVLAAVLAAIAAGIYPLVYGMVTVAWDYLFWEPFFFAAVAFVPAAVMFRLAAQMRFKWKHFVCRLMEAGAILIGGIAALLSAVFLHGAALSAAAVAIPIAACTLAGAIAGNCLVRTKQHTEILGQILGFKDFILYTEKDKIAFMMKEDPDLYYNILPYAQVLGVTDVWTDKFKGLDLAPPPYFYGAGDILFDCLYWNMVFSTFNHAFMPAMRSHPAISGNGNFGGGFGGFGGGGFGGGGARGC